MSSRASHLKLPWPPARQSPRCRGTAALAARRPVFQLDDATWHAHLAGRPLPPRAMPAATRHDIVALDYATWHAHLAGLEEAA